MVEQTREVSGSPLYQIDRDSPVAERLAELEYDLVDEIADETDGTDGEPLEFPESPP